MLKNGPFDSRAIANKILDYADQNDTPLTIMQLLKLVYLAHGWWLTFTNGHPLTSTLPQAWKYGPVYREVYNAFSRFDRRPITGRAVDPITGFEFYADMSNEVKAILEEVVLSYGKHHAFVLSDLMHKPGTPWSITVEEFGYYKPIKNDLIQREFDGLRQQ